MDFFDDPEIKKTYDKCKYIVKVWEHKFTKKYKRIPSKLDIREAPIEVRHAYRKYFKLKTQMLEQSFMDVEGFDDEPDTSQIKEPNNVEEMSQLQLSDDNFTEFVDDNKGSEVHSKVPEEIKNVREEAPVEFIQPPVNTELDCKVWGTHLNKPTPDIPKQPKNDNSVSKPVETITKKLFCGSKFNKRNPRKSLSFTQKKNSEVSFESPQFLSQPDLVSSRFKSEEAITALASEINTSLMEKSVNIVKTGNQFISLSVNQFSEPLPINIVDSLLGNKSKTFAKEVDTGWLKRVTENAGISLENSELSSSQFSYCSNNSLLEQPSESCLETKLDYDSDDLIENSDEEQENSRNTSIFHIAKKSRISYNPNLVASEALDNQNVQKKVLESNLNKLSLKENITNNVPIVPVPKVSDSNGEKNLCDLENPQRNVEREQIEGNIENHITNVNKSSKIYGDKPLETTEKLTLKKPRINQTQNNTNTKINKTPRKRKSFGNKKIKKTPEHQKTDNESPSLRRSSRKNKVKASLEELSSDEDPFACDNDEKDPEFILEKELAKKSNKKCIFDFEEIENEFDRAVENVAKNKPKKEKENVEKEKKKRGRKAKEKDKVEDADQTVTSGPNYELEFNVKPRVTAPRVNIKKVIKNQISGVEESSKRAEESNKLVAKDKKQQAIEKLEKKIASGTLNDNFVTINLRKKVFARGKKGHNFSKYKKSLWKSKKKALYGPDMDMGGCDGGQLTCFKCGLVGHFARNCKAEKGDGLLPLNAAEEEDECPFPTLEEASKMAADSVLSVRKPQLIVPSDTEPKLTEEISENMKQVEENHTTDAQEENDANEDETNSEQESIKSPSQVQEEEPASDDDWLDDDESDMLLAEVIKLEEHVKKLDLQAYMDHVKIVNPYYGLKDNGSVLDTTQEVYGALSKFGHSSFRQGQEKAIMRILSGKSTLVTLSTGSGKSLCYQLPAYLYSQKEPCISLVISPLVSLMEDQVTGIPRFLKAACLHTNQTKTQREKIMEVITSGGINVLLISPEAVVAGEKQTGFGSLLRKLPPIAFACIDEAHCVSQWSHNFRPSYLMICKVLRESLGVRTILGLTATATRATCESIIKSLEIPDGLEGIISDIPLPANLHLTVSKDANRDRALLNLLMSDRFKNCRSIIVYCTRRDECERIATFLRTSLKSEEFVGENTNKKRKRLNLQAEPYHAGLSASHRKSVQNAFMSGNLRIVVATVAFGMGINKSDIRAVIHYNMPNSFESYVQEVGRAGRDGLPAHCHVFMDSQGRDENELRRHIHANSIDRHVIRKLLQKIFIPCSCKGTCPKHEVAFSIEQTVRNLDIPEENISTLLCYLELHENKYIELLNPAYTNCKVISYGGPMQIRKAAKDCPPLAMAMALQKNKEKEENVLEFPVVDVASAMGWDSGICKHKLKNLEWTAVNNQPKRSSLSVQFSDLGFRLLAPGNLTDEQLDEALDSLFGIVQNQEIKALKQLRAVHKTLLEVAEKSYLSCLNTEGTADDADNSRDVLKLRIREYFNSADPLSNIGKESPKKINEEQLVNDIRAMICMYKDNQFTGRAIARIMHGIQSPNYPAVIWGRRCKFWRSHLHEDFNEICRIATREIINMRT